MFSFFRRKPAGLPFSAAMKRVLGTSRTEALQLDNDFIAVPHFLLAILREQDATVLPALDRLLVSPLLFEHRLATEVMGLRLTSRRPSESASLPLTVEMETALQQARQTAYLLEALEVEAAHLLLTMLRQPGGTAAVAAGEFGLTHDVLVARLRQSET